MNIMKGMGRGQRTNEIATGNIERSCTVFADGVPHTHATIRNWLTKDVLNCRYESKQILSTIPEE